MADIRFIDLTEAATPGADYFIPVDSATDGPKKIKTTNIVKVSDIGAASLTGTETLTNKTISGSANTLTNIPNSALTNSGVTISGTTVPLGGSKTLAPSDLGTMADSTILSNISGGVAAASANPITSVLDKLLGSTQGGVAYRGVSSWASLAPGTLGQYLKTQGAGTIPMWDTPAGGGDVLKSQNLSDLASIPTARKNLGVGVVVANRTALKALDTTKDTSAYLAEGNRAGLFNWLTGDFSANVTADTTEALYIASTGTPSTSGAWVRGSLGEVNILWGGADPTGSSDSAAIINALATLGFPMHAPAGNYSITASVNMTSGFKLRGDGIGKTVFTSSVNSFKCDVLGSTDYTNIELRDFTIAQGSNWGANTLTAIDFSNVSYSRVERVKCMYHQYGVFMRRTTSARQCYFNSFNEVWGFGCQYYFAIQDNGNTPNKHTFIDCRAEDNGQRSSGYGMDLTGWGHTVVGFYAGLPGHTAALRLQSGCGGLSAIGIYGESTTLTQVVLDDTTGNPNTINGVHADGLSTSVTKSNASCRTEYSNAGSATNVFGEVFVSASKTPPAVGTGSYDYTSFTVTGIAVGDTAKVIVPTAWPAGLVRGEPIVESGNVRLPYVNNSGGSLTPPSGTYTVAWQDRTP